LTVNTLIKKLANSRLIDYPGTYYSAELESSHNVILEEDKIFFRRNGYLPVRLKSIEEDLFIAENDRFEFIRDENNLIIGFDRCGNRVRRVVPPKIRTEDQEN
jgi:hypothetical protein